MSVHRFDTVAIQHFFSRQDPALPHHPLCSIGTALDALYNEPEAFKMGFDELYLVRTSLRTIKDFTRLCKVVYDHQLTRVETNDSFTKTVFDKVSYFYIYAILGCKVKGMKVIVEADWPLNGWHATFQQDFNIPIHQVVPEASEKVFDKICTAFFSSDEPSILILPVNRPWTTLPAFKTKVKPVYVLTLDATTPITASDSSTRPHISGRLKLYETMVGGFPTWACASIEEKSTVKELVCVGVGPLKSFGQDGFLDVTYRPKVPIEQQLRLVAAAESSSSDSSSDDDALDDSESSSSEEDDSSEGSETD
ncbi:hypothetical protein MBLNU457_1846t1 [Dothideomycetes sp. NU457]